MQDLPTEILSSILSFLDDVGFVNAIETAWFMYDATTKEERETRKVEYIKRLASKKRRDKARQDVDEVLSETGTVGDFVGLIPGGSSVPILDLMKSDFFRNFMAGALERVQEYTENNNNDLSALTANPLGLLDIIGDISQLTDGIMALQIPPEDPINQGDTSHSTENPQEDPIDQALEDALKTSDDEESSL